MADKIVKRVLVYRLGSLGDHLVAVPCYRLVRRAFPGAKVRLLTNVPVANKAAAADAVLGGSGLVDDYMTYVMGERGPMPLLKLIWAIRRYKPEVLVYLAGPRGLKAARRDGIFFRLCGVKRTVGLPDTEEFQKNKLVGLREGVAWFEQEGLRLARCIAKLGDADVKNPASWAPGLTEHERADGMALIAGLGGAGYFAFSIGTKAQSNMWGVERWCELLARMAAEWPGYGLAVLGAAEEREVSEQVAEAWRGVAKAGPALNLCGSAKPRVSAAVMERALMFLGHDSGPGHMAAAVGTPVVGVFSARMMPGEWVPHGEHVQVVMHWVDCGGCLLETCIAQGKKCILSIGVEEVLSVVRKQMARISC